MKQDRVSRNDFILLVVFVGMVSAIVLVAFAPVADEATLTMRLWAIASSPIALGVISTFIAAFAGTWGAQLLAERTANRKALLSEIRGTNSALGLVFTITNTYLATKKQHIRGLVQDYEAQVAARQAHAAGAKAGSPFAYRLDLQTIAPPFSPIDELRQMLRERITPDGKAMILLTPLVQSIHGFADIAAQRNAWIAEVKAMPENSDAMKSAWFFGLLDGLWRGIGGDGSIGAGIFNGIITHWGPTLLKAAIAAALASRNVTGGAALLCAACAALSDFMASRVRIVAPRLLLRPMAGCT